MTAQPRSRDDVLDAFAMEDRHDRLTLERYLREHPDYAIALVDLSRELMRHVVEHDDPLSPREREMIASAWKRHAAAVPGAVADPFAKLAVVVEQRELARRLDVPRQVIAAFRERRVLAASIPQAFIRKFAAAANLSIEALLQGLAMAQATPSASYKSDVKPDEPERVPFEQVLVEAGIPERRRHELMADGD